MGQRDKSAGPWARRVLGDWFVCYPSSSFVLSLIVPTARIFDKSNFPPPPPPPQPKGPAEQSAGVNMNCCESEVAFYHTCILCHPSVAMSSVCHGISLSYQGGDPNLYL